MKVIKQPQDSVATGMYLTKHGRKAKPLKSWNVYQKPDGTECFKELFGKGRWVTQEDVENDIGEHLLEG